MIEVLREAQTIGLVGRGPVDGHLDHARGFAEVVGTPPDGTLLDLGSGAGLPGLVLALMWTTTTWVLLDGRTRSARFLAQVVPRLGLQERVKVVHKRAEVLAHDPAYRTAMDLVVARSVGPASAVAECAAGFLVPGGRLVVSEPPELHHPRWDEAVLAGMGMGPAIATKSSGGYHFSLVEQRLSCPPRFPRRTGVPVKRPLF